MPTLREQLVLHEGLRRVPYVDSVGKVTAGIGHNLAAHPLDDRTINQWYEADVLDAIGLCTLLLTPAYFYTLGDVRERVLIDMAFNLGHGLETFVKFLAAVKAGQWQEAAIEMLQSKWAEQVGRRAERLAAMMETGKDYTA
jgi:lysozyme